MGRESAERRNAALRRVARACEGMGLPVEEEGASRVIRIAPDRRLRVRGGGGSGVLKVDALLEDGTVDTESSLPVDNLIGRLADIAARQGEEE